MLGLLGLGAAAGPSVAQEAFNSISIGSQGNTIVPTAYLDKETTPLVIILFVSLISILTFVT